MSDKKLTIAVDFDGTLCEFAFPGIGEQRRSHKMLMSKLIQLRNEGHKLILWTNRGDNEEYPVLTEAIEWCKERGLEYVITDISEDEDPLWDRFGINVVPTLLVFRGGKIVARKDGALFNGLNRESLIDLFGTKDLI